MSGILVIIVTYNSALTIGELLGSLVECVAHCPRLDIVVVDNASIDATETVVAGFPSVRFIQSGGNLGYAAAINLGMSALTDHKAILVLNPDVVITAGALAYMVADLQDPKVGIVFPRLVDSSQALQHSIRRDPTLLRVIGEALLGGRRAGRFGSLGEIEQREEHYARRCDVDWATGAALLVSSACARTIGPWDERYFLYSEEVDYAGRARASGFDVIYEPAAVVVHYEGESNTSPYLYSMLTVNRARHYGRYHSPLAGLAFRMALLLHEFLRLRKPIHRRAALALLSRRSWPLRPDGGALGMSWRS